MTGADSVINTRPVLIMAGGTGGHVFPALAVAQEMISRNIPVIWLGTHQGIESKIIPAAGIPIEWVSVSGLRGKRFSRIIKAPFMLAVAAWQCFRIIMKIKPGVVLGMGGFVTGPGGVVARILGKPLCIHEQNAVAGMTNRYLAHIANRILVAFPGSLNTQSKAITVGNPVRQAIIDLPVPEQRFSERKGPVRILVLGGSLGAQALNELVPQALAQLSKAYRPRVVHQTGEANIEQTRRNYSRAEYNESAEIIAFIDDMASAYANSDLVICRAGALTVSELMTVGVASLLVPYPYAVDDHQTKNARYLEDAGAAILIQQSELTPEKLFQLLSGLIEDRSRLLAMAKAARALARPDATRQVASECLALGGYA